MNATDRTALRSPERGPRAGSRRAPEEEPQPTSLNELQRLQTTVGNRGMQQLLGGVRGLLGEGAPLPDALRLETEARLGADLSGVRIHDHPAAHALAQEQLARAFTVGADVVFGRGRYQPGSTEGRQLLVHELAHVVQQTGRGAAISAGGSHEQAADQAASAFVRGGAGPINAGPPAPRSVQRTPLTETEIQELSLAGVRARILANEQEGRPVMLTDEYRAQLGRENILLKERANALILDARAHQLSGSPPAVAPAADPDAELKQVMGRIAVELADVAPLVGFLSIDVLLHPANHALNEVRNMDARLRDDEKAVREFEPLAGSRAAEVHAALLRFQALLLQLAPALAVAIKWHDDNTAESLGMLNERAGTWLAGAGASQWDKGGVHYVSGALAYIGAFGMAFLDAGEKVISMGYHDTATAVAQAYTRGDISWSEGEDIMDAAATRAIVIAATTRGVGAATRGLGVLGAEATGLASTTLRYGAVSGAIPGGLSAIAATGTQALLTKGMEDHFKSPTGKAIWMQAMPQGKDWAIAIPLGIVMGGLGGMRGVEISNEKLVGTIINTPEGPMEVLSVTQLKITTVGGKLGLSQPGVMVLKPVGGSVALLPPAPVGDLVMVLDPASKTWVYPQGSPAALATVPAPKTVVPPTGDALVPVGPSTGGVAGGAGATGGMVTKALVAGASKALGSGSAVQTAPVVIPPAPKLPVTANTTRAAQRLAQTETSLASANDAANLARAKVARAQADLGAANELSREAGGGKDAKALVKAAEADLRKAEAELKPLARSEATALRERDAVVRGGSQVAKIEQELADLEQQMTEELRRSKYIVPPIGTPEGQLYHRLAARRANALERLRSEVEGLSRSLGEQVSAATPGASARPTALANAAQLDPVLRPVNGTPIDVTTGKPMKSGDWATDHIVSRSEIASDPRFARLTPMQRDAMLLEIPENYLPITPEANSSKLNLTVDEWIGARSANGKPLPTDMAKALRAANARAHAAIEAMFNKFLPVP